MTLALTTQEVEEARVLIARLGVLLGEREAAPGSSVEVDDVPKIGLRDVDYADAADALKCDVAAVRAVDQVESNGKGFGPDGRPLILFEPHVFSRLTQHRFDDSHGGVSYPKWGAKPYPKDQKARWDQLLYAAKLDRDAAYQAASYGRFQIMGFNFALCAFSNVHGFVAAMQESERAQLFAFVQFVSASGLADELREHRWEDFARRYNGPAYATHGYHTKLAAAHARHAAA